jgi:eukaryotic-like serine/threonine-protein kinase
MAEKPEAKVDEGRDASRPSLPSNPSHPSNPSSPSNPSRSGISSRSDAEDPLIGKVLNDRVKIVRTIARGGMGKVYYGEQISMGRPCAIKVLDPKTGGGDADREEFAKRFLLEASTSSKLTHPNVITIFDYGQTEDGICYIAMEYLEGRTLAQEIRDKGKIGPERACDIARQVCRSLREAHTMGIVHRDLKPGNVFLCKHDDEGDFCKVLDFGLAKAAKIEDDTGNNLTRVGQVMGSPRYMAPEQIQGKEIDARADIYALGCVLFAMVTGKPPFDRPTEIATMMAHMSDPVPEIASLHPDLVLPQGLEAIVMRCLEKNPDDRFGSMEEVISALRIVAPGVTAYTISGMHTAKATTSRPDMNPPSLATSSGEVSAIKSHAPPPKKGSSAGLWIGIGLVAVAAIGGVIYATRSEPTTDPLPVATTTAPATTTVVATVTTSAAPAVPTAKLHIETDPPGARVIADDVEVCASTPCDVVWKGAQAAEGKDHLLEIKKAEHKPEKKMVKSSQDQINVKLSKIR